jgi:viologen exporter family transport system permease protein
MRYLRLLWLFAQTEFQFAVEYRANLVLDLFEEVVVVATSLIAVSVLFTHTGTLNGWSLGQMIVLLGVYYLIQGAQSVVFEVSLERFMEHIRLGTLDFILIKPVNSQFMVSTRHVQLAQVAQALFGLGLVGAGVAQVGAVVGVGDVVRFAVTLFCGLSLVYCVILILSTIAFWATRIENLLAIFWSFLDAGRFPVDVYPGWLRVTLSTVVPIGVAVTVPAQAIAGRLDTIGLIVMVAGSVAVFAFATWFWRVGVRNYTGASA